MIAIQVHEIPFSDRILFEKAARESGFDISVVNHYLHFRCTDSPGEIVLGTIQDQPLAMFKVPPLLPPFKGNKINLQIHLAIDGFDRAEIYAFEDMSHLMNALRMYYLENKLPLDRTSHFYKEQHESDLTTKEMLSEIRVKQGLFRENLMHYWNARCALTGIRINELLRASHIKPWAVSSNMERLDVYNGLLLNAFADAAFDKGLITFYDDGTILFSEKLSDFRNQFHTLAGKVSLKEQHLPYIQYHRKYIFVDQVSCDP